MIIAVCGGSLCPVSEVFSGENRAIRTGDVWPQYITFHPTCVP